jgi:hypothetical protein
MKFATSYCYQNRNIIYNILKLMYKIFGTWLAIYYNEKSNNKK